MADYSFIANPAIPQAPNPLAMVGQYAQVGNALLGMQARQAVGQAFQQSADPNTGQIDYQKALGAITQDPRAAWMAPQIAQQIQQQQLLGYKLNEMQLAQTQQRTNAINSALGSFLAKPANEIGTGDVTSMLAGMKAAGYPVDEFVNDAAATMPSGGQALKDWVTQHFARTMPPTAQAEMFGPKPTPTDTGGSIQFLNTNPYSNPSIIGQTIGRTLTPGEQLMPVPGPVGPKGQQTSMTGAQRAAWQGLSALLPQGMSLGTGRLPNSLLNPNRQAAAATAPMPGAYPDVGGGAPAPSSMAPAGPGPMVTKLGSGQEEALQKVAGASGDLAAGLTTSAADIPARQGMLTAMLGDLTRMDTGPNSPGWSNLMGRLSQLGVATPSMKEGQAARENFAKMASQFYQMQAQKLGVITNDKLSTAAMSNPNELFTTLGNQGVIHVFQGNEDALNAKNQAWLAARQQGTPPDDYDQWQARFNKGFDPRAFWLARMSPEERATLIKGMSKSELPKFQQSVATAVDNGWIDPNQLIGQSGGR